MNNLSNERLEQIAMYGAQYNTPEARQMARELLALREAGKEPVAWEWQNRHQRHVTNDEERARNLAWDGVKVIPLYAAPQLPAVPDGWVMVPKVPTMAMMDEFDSIIDYGAEDSKDAWSRLIAAAPKPEVK